MPGMGSRLGVEVPYRSRWRKLLAKGKGVIHREVEPERSRRQNSDPRNTNRISGWIRRASLRDKAKPVAIKERSSKCGGCGGKAAILTRGGLGICRETKGSARDSERFPEVSRGHSSPAEAG